MGLRPVFLFYKVSVLILQVLPSVVLKRLGQQGYVIRNEGYELDDPFFRRWIEVKREGR